MKATSCSICHQLNRIKIYIGTKLKMKNMSFMKHSCRISFLKLSKTKIFKSKNFIFQSIPAKKCCFTVIQTKLTILQLQNPHRLRQSSPCNYAAHIRVRSKENRHSLEWLAAFSTPLQPTVLDHLRKTTNRQKKLEWMQKTQHRPYNNKKN